MEPIQVQGAPTIYQCYQGVLEKLPKKLSEQNFKQSVIIHGEKSWNAAKKYVKNLNIPTTTIKYSGECTHEEVSRINTIIKQEKADVIIGVGGGKILDIAKANGHALNLPVVLIPTLASNCAAWTPLSVFYDQAGNFVEYTIFPKSTFMVLVEPNIIINSPVPFLRAGIGDTIAKWYEADVLTRNLPDKPIPLEVALHAAKLCRNVLLEKGNSAIDSLQKGQISSDFIHTLETIILAAGMVGGYGDKYGRISGAHSIHNALTHVPETHDHLHGDKVAYGVLVQLALEKRADEINYLLPHYKKMKLPSSLAELGVIHNQSLAIETISEKAVQPGESIHFMNISKKEQVREAIEFVETTIG
ncbi:iron-containing alcohol dehydrogenase [Aquibacillus halophilus]|uniref:Iron-containing alcohol dehydrogenase n=1 Tax=Aquibacillus halophilus TaxID=930132 RepID=A0A6A8DIS9_9BACI|nr:iron-containing alcohol dehydrogenase family protein [Aquibacillus halophilus]MRH43709.1 iron-containing alcohol dehydrogenase [Aquibacillus halophilus]